MTLLRPDVVGRHPAYRGRLVAAELRQIQAVHLLTPSAKGGHCGTCPSGQKP
jgi:hypothetical protein